MKQKRVRDTLVMAIDFGTTFSGFAFAYSEAADELEVIHDWPGGKGLTYQKVPTEITYEAPKSLKLESVKIEEAKSSSRLIDALKSEPASGAAKGLIKNIRWGYEIRRGEKRIQCIKLFLDKNQPLPEYVSDQDILSQLQEHGRDIEDVVADYLTKLIDHAEQVLKARLPAEFLAKVKCLCVPTVPANWTDKAKHITLSALKRAGVTGDVHVISEPEAAARYCLQDRTAKWLSTGSHVVVCDAGGGTVDLISYCIDNKDPIRLKESTFGTAAICGSALLNKNFERVLRAALGTAEHGDKLPPHLERTIQTAMNDFETIHKRDFCPDNDEDIYIPCPGVADNEAAGLESGYLRLTVAQMKEVFEPIVLDVLKVLDGQVRSLQKKQQSVSAILLVGGFGQSQYLASRVKAQFCRDIEAKPEVLGKRSLDDLKTADAKIQVLQPANAWTAVLRGAVLRGLEGNFVGERRCRRNYGTECSEVHDPKIHSPARRYLDRHERRHMTGGLMQWFVHKDEAITEDCTFTLDFHETWGGQRFPYSRVLDVRIELYSNDSDEAPHYKDDGPVTKVCTLWVKLDKVPERYFVNGKTKPVPGVKYLDDKYFFTLKYQLEMKISNEQLHFRLMIDGKEYGQAVAEYQDRK